MSNHDATQWYTEQLKAWPKQAGPKVNAELLETVHRLGARPGKQAMANAMYLRDGGATTAQVCMVVGAPQLNKMRGFITDGLLKREAVSPSAEGHTVYRLTLTAKGAAKVKRAEATATDKAAVADKPVKAERAKVARKAKATSEPASVLIPAAKPVDATPVDTEQAQA